MVGDHQALRPDRPFFLYLSLSAPHAPHQAPDKYLQRNRGRFDRGWDFIRSERPTRMKPAGIVPQNTAVAPRAPGVKAWAEMSPIERRVNSRFQEAYAAFMEHTDDQLGRLMSFFQDRGLTENTILFLLSDNGASQEGGLLGSTNQMTWPNSMPPTLEQNVSKIDDIGTVHAHSNYPLGWAQVSNTPFQRFKQNVHFGGVRDPLIIHWPARIKDRGGIRTQFHHLIDVMPTVLDVTGAQAPTSYRGVTQLPIAGTSMTYTFDSASEPGRRTTQYFEMYGHRGIYDRGWKAVTFHVKGTPFESDKWELYNTAEDFSETRDLALRNPRKLDELKQIFQAEATKYGVLPLDDRTFELRLVAKSGMDTSRVSFDFYRGMPDLPSNVSPDIKDRSYSITATIRRTRPTEEGVIIAHGDVDGGYVLYVKDNRLVHEYNYIGTPYKVVSTTRLPVGQAKVRFQFERTGAYTGTGRLFVNGVKVGEAPIPHTVRNIISFSPLSIGRDSLSPVSSAYRGDFPFQGELGKVTLEISR
jgi:arylsulfatase